LTRSRAKYELGVALKRNTALAPAVGAWKPGIKIMLKQGQKEFNGKWPCAKKIEKDAHIL
jgi:hypothetical protein